jgi:hypothetical protein
LDATLDPPVRMQRLNANDRALLAVNRALQRLGAPGFETQMLLELAGRVELDRLRAALERLHDAEPVLGARLAAARFPDRYWQAGPGARPCLQESALPSAALEHALQFAGAMLSRPRDLYASPPVRFHVLHRPDGRDVLLMHYNHAALDNHAAVLLVQAINRVFAGDEAARTPDNGDGILQYLRRTLRTRRRQAVRDTIDVWRRWQRGGIVTLGRVGAGPRQKQVELGIVTRTVAPAAAAALRQHTLRVCGFPSLSMALLGSAFRAVASQTGEHAKGHAGFCAGIGVDLGLRGPDGPIFHNLMSLVPVHAAWSDLTDRDELLRHLNRQLRERLAAAMDLGILQFVTLFSRRPQYAEWALDIFFRHSFSLWYGYFGSLDGLGETWCGVPIEDAFFIGPSWPPMGLTLLANQFRGRLRLQATYVADAVPDAVATAFLEAVATDLVPPQRDGREQS